MEVEPGGDQKQPAYRIVATCGSGINVVWKRTSREGNDYLSAGLADRGAAPDFPGNTRPRAASIWSGAAPPSPTEPKRKDA